MHALVCSSLTNEVSTFDCVGSEEGVSRKASMIEGVELTPLLIDLRIGVGDSTVDGSFDLTASLGGAGTLGLAGSPD